MLEEYIENEALNLKALEEDLFAVAYQDCTFDYAWSNDHERDYENARWTWEWDSLFVQFIREQLENAGYRECIAERAHGHYVWIREFDLLMVKPDHEVGHIFYGSFSVEELDGVEFASGTVYEGRFYAQTTADKVIV